MGRVLERMVEDRLLGLGRQPVRVRPLRPSGFVDQPLRTEGLVVAADPVELLAAVADDPARLGDPGSGPGQAVAEVLREFEQAELSACYPCVRGHVGLLAGVGGVRRHHRQPRRSGMATPATGGT
jgi:hypothetical protein